ncbi:MAG: helix-turn-helix transcriptional regulator [Eubacteriales bacterium]|nr:helix-turn-helix transcriptional regulator [Eubacteriales bacterium]
MELNHIGELIRHRRLELGLTQEVLCEGICEPPTLSRIESGKRGPSANRLQAILQRLQLPEQHYISYIGKDLLDLYARQDEIRMLHVRHNWIPMQKKLDEMAALLSEDDVLFQQFILRSRTALGEISDGKRIPYPMDRQITLLQQAMHLTQPHFDINRIEDGVYSVEELKLINQIAAVYTDHARHKEALAIYRQLERFLKKYGQNLYSISGVACMITYNHALNLSYENDPDETIRVAKLGQEYCIRFRTSAYLAMTIELLAYAYHQKGEFEKSREYFMESYYVCHALKDEANLEIIKRDAKNKLGMDLK